MESNESDLIRVERKEKERKGVQEVCFSFFSCVQSVPTSCIWSFYSIKYKPSVCNFPCESYSVIFRTTEHLFFQNKSLLLEHFQ